MYMQTPARQWRKSCVAVKPAMVMHPSNICLSTLFQRKTGGKENNSHAVKPIALPVFILHYNCTLHYSFSEGKENTSHTVKPIAHPVFTLHYIMQFFNTSPPSYTLFWLHCMTFVFFGRVT